MINQQMLDFIRQQSKLGRSREEIKQALLKTGWREQDIEENFKAAVSGALAPAAAAQPGGQLPGPTEILKSSWETYKQRFGVLLGIYLLPYVSFIILALLSSGVGIFAFKAGNPLILLLIVALFIAMIYLGIWSEASIIVAIRDSGEKIGVMEAYKRSRGRIGALFLASLLAGLAVMGGMILLIIPGLIFAVWFSQTSYVAVMEGIGGTEALSRSKKYITGRFWPVVGRLAFIVLIALAVSIAAGLLGNALFGNGNSAPKSLVTGLINVFFVPLAAIYGFQLYSHLKATLK